MKTYTYTYVSPAGNGSVIARDATDALCRAMHILRSAGSRIHRSSVLITQSTLPPLPSMSAPIVECEASKREREAERTAALAAAKRLIKRLADPADGLPCASVPSKPACAIPCDCWACEWVTHARAWLNLADNL